MNPQLDSYIQQARQAGQTDEQIKQALLGSGWTQSHVNEAFGLPQVPSEPVIPPPPMHPSMANSSSSMPGANHPMAGEFLDKKTQDTVIWSVVGYFVRSLIAGLAASIASYLFFSSVNIYGINVPIYHQSFYFDFGGLISNSIIGGLVFGLVLAKLYPKLEAISTKYLGGKLYNFYRMIFYPAIAAGILSAILVGGFSVFLGGQFLMYLLLVIAGDIFGAYIFAKLMVSKVGQYYPTGK